MSEREIAAAAAKKYVLSLDNATANPPADRYHSVITLITLGKAEEAENINREKFLQAILTEFGGGRGQGGGFRYFGPQIGCLAARVRVSNGLPVLAGQNEAAAPGQLFSVRR